MSGFVRSMAWTCVLTALVAAAPGATGATNPSGFWRGTISLQGVQLGIEVSLKESEGGWKGKINIPTQGIRDFGLDLVAVEADKVTFTMPGIGGDPTFLGNLSEDGATISGDFRQSGQTFPFSLTRSEEPPADAPDPYGPWLADGTPGDGFVGDWLGLIESGPSKIRIVLHIAANPEGGLTGTLDVVDQGFEGIALDKVEAPEHELVFQMNGIGASFTGALASSGTTIDGKWTQGPATLPLVFKRKSSAP